MDQERKQRRRVVKAHLREYRNLRREEKSILEQIEGLRNRMDLQAIVLTGQPRGTVQYTLADYAADLDELHEQINMMPDPLHRVILTDYYLLEKPFELIADKLGYSLARIHHLHADALDAFPFDEDTIWHSF